MVWWRECSGKSYSESSSYDDLYGYSDEFRMYSIELCSSDSESTTYGSSYSYTFYYMQWSVFDDSGCWQWRYRYINLYLVSIWNGSSS